MTSAARSALLLAGALSACLLPVPVPAQDAAPPPAQTPDGPAAAGATGGPSLPYTVELTGVAEDDLAGVLRETSTLFGLRDDPPPTLLGLERRADADRETLQTTLRSAGFYDATIDIRVDAARTPAAVTVAVDPGPAYTFDTVEILGAGGAPLPGGPVPPADLGLVPGARARGPVVVAAEERLLARLGEHGYAHARAVDRRVVVDHSDRTMDITYTVDPGPLVRFGETRIEGLEGVDEALVRGRLPWTRGDEYRPELVERARREIAQLDVFDTVRVALGDEAGAGGVTPVTVTLVERKRRFIGAGVFFSTSEGLGTQVYWGHRNLFGGAEYLRVQAQLGRLNAQTAGSGGLEVPDLQFNVQFRKPDFLDVHQTLAVNFAVVSEQPPAYDRIATTLSGSLERRITDELRAGYGVAFERGRVEANDRLWQTALVGVPLSLTYDGSDNLLNPTTGFRASLAATPWFPVGGDTEKSFYATALTGSAYYDLTGDGDYVAAARANIGSVLGAGLDEIPPDKRLYAGGGGSVRGYAFQKVGPRDVEGDPVGGRSLAEFGLEMRIKVTDSIGIVPFLDAGMVYDSTFPTFGGMKYGAGLGVRYYTGFGPLRVDVGFPLNPEPQDAKWQLYLSLGQAF
ncbi:autotransporter assembly complex protein TamA [Azospirillum sp. A39]|uniref:autotransporter assembly complex protein TamA n=1 Tax=Azospirillum sp. A39 TaxID=3462279 RepID=UPI00404682C2